MHWSGREVLRNAQHKGQKALKYVDYHQGSTGQVPQRHVDGTGSKRPMRERRDDSQESVGIETG